jgi:hypothetical protein
MRTTADSDQVEPLTPMVIASAAKQSRAAERSIGRDCFVAQDAPRNDGVHLVIALAIGGNEPLSFLRACRPADFRNE